MYVCVGGCGGACVDVVFGVWMQPYGMVVLYNAILPPTLPTYNAILPPTLPPTMPSSHPPYHLQRHPPTHPPTYNAILPPTLPTHNAILPPTLPTYLLQLVENCMELSQTTSFGDEPFRLTSVAFKVETR